MAVDGLVTERLIAYQAARAASGAGLIVTQVAGVHESACYTSHVLMATEDECIPGFRRLAAAIHEHGTAVVGQVFHDGRELMETAWHHGPWKRRSSMDCASRLRSDRRHRQ